MSELQKELDKDQAFINEVHERIYCESDDWEDSIAEPEWIMGMTDLADKYLRRFKAAENGRRQVVQDKAKLIAMRNSRLSENQELALVIMTSSFKRLGNSTEQTILEYLTPYYPDEKIELGNIEFLEVLQAFATWALNQC